MHKYSRYMLEDLDEHVFGHLIAKKTLITLINRSQLRWMQKWHKGMDEEHLISPMKVLLLGASGSGKTHLIQSLRKIAHFPLVQVDATQLLPSGASSGGVNLLNLMKQIDEEAHYCASVYPETYGHADAALDRLIVFVDEVDKLGNSFESTGNWNRHVQSNFLTLFDNKDKYSGVSFIFAGAFNDITQKKKGNEKKHNLGFTTNAIDNEDEFIDEKIVKCGLVPELVGRMTAIVELDILTKEDYTSILHTKVLPKKARDLAAYGIFDVVLDDYQIEDLADRAIRSGQGVRYLHREVDKHFLEVEFEASACYEELLLLEQDI